MPAASPKCAKCDKAMVEGFLTGPWMYQPRSVQTWVKGRPETPAVFGTKPKGRKPLVVVAWRCAGCGRLESYAN